MNYLEQTICNPQLNKTAVLVFANSAQREAALKPFRRSGHLFRELNRHTLQIVRQSGLPYFLFSEKEQKGNSFGERYVNAIESVYAQGFENVITIGNDTPHLQAENLIETAEKLRENPIVLGPSSDGGYYLLGLNRSQFNAKTFLKLPWQTPGLTQSISCLLASKNIKVAFLKILSDIDAVSDIPKIIGSFSKLSAVLERLLLSFLIPEKKPSTKPLFSFQNFLKENQFNKGSPIFAS